MRKQPIGTTKQLVFGSLCIALCVALPQAFHAVPNAGNILLPMHIPVLLCGLVSGWPFGLICGLLGPALSSLLTSMPPAAILPTMMAECALYGCISGIMMNLVHTKKLYADLYLSLGAAMLVGRIVAGVLKALIFAPGTMTMAVWATSYFVTGLPGILLQLILIPNLVAALMKVRLLPARYMQRI